MRRNQYNDIVKVGSKVAKLQTSLAQTNSLAKIAKDIQTAQTGLYQSNEFRNAVATLTQLQAGINQSSRLRNAAEVITQLQTGLYQSNEFRNAVATLTQLQTGINQSIGLRNTARVATRLQTSLSQSNDLKMLASVSKQAADSLQLIHVEFSKSYVTLLQGIAAEPTKFGVLPPMVATLPSVELYNSNHVLEVFSEQGSAPELQEEYQHEGTEIASDIENSLESLLSELDPGLKLMWQGVNDALASESVDRVRHFSVSARELFTQVIHILAPDEEIGNWTDDPNHFSNDRPTRKARVLYICRDFNHKQFSNFVNKDISASIALSDLLQSGVHAIETDFTPGQVSALKIRVEGTLRFLLETARAQTL